MLFLTIVVYENLIYCRYMCGFFQPTSIKQTNNSIPIVEKKRTSSFCLHIKVIGFIENVLFLCDFYRKHPNKSDWTCDCYLVIFFFVVVAVFIKYESCLFIDTFHGKKTL